MLEQARTIAVLGASTKPERPACYVPDYLHAQGYRIIPVNPLHLQEQRWGERFRQRLQDIGEPIDIVISVDKGVIVAVSPSSGVGPCGDGGAADCSVEPCEPYDPCDSGGGGEGGGGGDGPGVPPDGPDFDDDDYYDDDDYLDFYNT